MSVRRKHRPTALHLLSNLEPTETQLAARARLQSLADDATRLMTAPGAPENQRPTVLPGHVLVLYALSRQTTLAEVDLNTDPADAATQEAIADYLGYKPPWVSALLIDLTVRLRKRGAIADLALEESSPTTDRRRELPKPLRRKKFYRLTEAGEDLLDNLFPPALAPPAPPAPAPTGATP